MASSCMQLCLQCRRFLLLKPVASAWHSSPTKVVNASTIVRWSHKTTWTRRRMQQILFFNDFAVKHLSTDSKGKKGIDELSMTDVSYKSPLLPVKDAVPSSFNQMSFGTFWSRVYYKENHWNFDLKYNNTIFAFFFLTRSGCT